ncbi:MAG TPA: PDZ domain-containing protein [Thermoanaerobaculia bacterium]|nr:PDZ domain-containing protein [Thermoanaerobaculia bacterium]
MTARLPHFLFAALLFVPAAYADDRKMCTASARECEQAIRQLSSGRRYLGAQIEELDPGIAIKAINEDGPAARADLRPGDRLMAVNGRSTVEADIKDFKQILYSAKETGVLWIIIKRQGILKKIDVRLAPYSKAQIDRMVAQHLAQAHSMATATAPPP